MVEDLKQAGRAVADAIQQRMTLQWGEPQPLCHFNRGSRRWQFSYRPPSSHGTQGALLTLSRDGRERFALTLKRPEIELRLWHNCLVEVLRESDQRGLGWWMRLMLRLRGRRIECSRIVYRDETPLGRTVKDTRSCYVARLAGWRQPSVRLVESYSFSTTRSRKVSTSSFGISLAECQQMAVALAHFNPSSPAPPRAPWSAPAV
jgi:hypothetical protein